MRIGFLLSLLLAICPLLRAQDDMHIRHQRLMFWNLENAFWPENEPSTNDDEFTPEGSRHWTMGRLRQKLLQLSRVVLAAGDGRAPMVVGLAEVEGDSVLHYWLHHTPMREQHYASIMTHGVDPRGIEVALLYQPTDFRLINKEEYAIGVLHQSHPTRSVLHAAGRLVSGDTLDVIVCHLPSRMGGVRQSQPYRDAAHQTLIQVADSIRLVRQHPQIVIMGDMNDYPKKKKAWWGNDFENLMVPLQKALRRNPWLKGSHKYQGEWGFLDQFIINRAWHGVSNARVFSLPFMLTDDESYLGHRPKRSYYGYQHEGGYSDHLPILLDMDIAF